MSHKNGQRIFHTKNTNYEEQEQCGFPFSRKCYEVDNNTPTAIYELNNLFLFISQMTTNFHPYLRFL